MSGIYESIIWDTPSRNAGESMPVGGYDIGINVWFENGEILLYFGRSDSFDENNTLLKSGRIRVHFFHERIQFVRQIFRVQQGDVQVELKVDDSPLRVEVWCSQNQSCFSLHLETEKEILYGISYENWRYERKRSPMMVIDGSVVVCHVQVWRSYNTRMIWSRLKMEFTFIIRIQMI